MKQEGGRKIFTFFLKLINTFSEQFGIRLGDK